MAAEEKAPPKEVVFDELRAMWSQIAALGEKIDGMKAKDSVETEKVVRRDIYSRDDMSCTVQQYGGCLQSAVDREEQGSTEYVRVLNSCYGSRKRRAQSLPPRRRSKNAWQNSWSGENSYRVPYGVRDHGNYGDGGYLCDERQEVYWEDQGNCKRLNRGSGEMPLTVEGPEI